MPAGGWRAALPQLKFGLAGDLASSRRHIHRRDRAGAGPARPGAIRVEQGLRRRQYRAKRHHAVALGLDHLTSGSQLDGLALGLHQAALDLGAGLGGCALDLGGNSSRQCLRQFRRSGSRQRLRSSRITSSRTMKAASYRPMVRPAVRGRGSSPSRM